jgi:hypothetical protein
MKISYTKKIIETDRENPGFLRKQPSLQNSGLHSPPLVTTGKPSFYNWEYTRIRLVLLKYSWTPMGKLKNADGIGCLCNTLRNRNVILVSDI